MPSMTERRCQCCGKPFQARTADVARGWAKFCSKRCKAIEQEGRTGQYAAMLAGDVASKNAAVKRPDVPRIASNLPAAGWTWRDRTGGHHAPQTMETRHLFYTLRMIWNNTMPANAHVGQNPRYYAFGPFYTVEYMKTAVVHIATELATRPDMRANWLRELEQMRRYFDKDLQRIEQQLKELSK